MGRILKLCLMWETRFHLTVLDDAVLRRIQELSLGEYSNMAYWRIRSLLTSPFTVGDDDAKCWTATSLGCQPQEKGSCLIASFKSFDKYIDIYKWWSK